MSAQKQDIARRAIRFAKLNNLIPLVQELVSNDKTYAEFSESPLDFFRKRDELKDLSEYFSEKSDFAEITGLVKKIREAVQKDALDYDFLFNFAELRGIKPNYERSTWTEYNFTKKESSEVNYTTEGQSIRKTKAGWKSSTNGRLKQGQDSGFKRTGKGEIRLVLADQDMGPLINQKLLKAISETTKE